MNRNENPIRSISFAIGNDPGQKPPGNRINDTFFGNTNIEVDSLLVANVPNTNNFSVDTSKEDLTLGGSSVFTSGDFVKIFYKQKAIV